MTWSSGRNNWPSLAPGSHSMAMAQCEQYQCTPVFCQVQSWALIDAMLAHGMRRPAGFRVAATQHAAAAAQFHDHDQTVAIVAEGHVAAPPLAAEMPAAHPFDGQGHALVRGHAEPSFIAVAPDALMRLQNRFQHRVLTPALCDLGQQVLHPGHQHIVRDT